MTDKEKTNQKKGSNQVELTLLEEEIDNLILRLDELREEKGQIHLNFENNQELLIKYGGSE